MARSLIIEIESKSVQERVCLQIGIFNLASCMGFAWQVVWASWLVNLQSKCFQAGWNELECACCANVISDDMVLMWQDDTDEVGPSDDDIVSNLKNLNICWIYLWILLGKLFRQVGVRISKASVFRLVGMGQNVVVVLISLMMKQH